MISLQERLLLLKRNSRNTVPAWYVQWLRDDASAADGCLSVLSRLSLRDSYLYLVRHARTGNEAPESREGSSDVSLKP
jgi:hypothetical protein